MGVSNLYTETHETDYGIFFCKANGATLHCSTFYLSFSTLSDLSKVSIAGKAVSLLCIECVH